MAILQAEPSVEASDRQEVARELLIELLSYVNISEQTAMGVDALLGTNSPFLYGGK